jgi:hypothetical protein
LFLRLDWFSWCSLRLDALALLLIIKVFLALLDWILRYTLFHRFDTLDSHLREEGSLDYDGGLVRLQVQPKFDTHIDRQQQRYIKRISSISIVTWEFNVYLNLRALPSQVVSWKRINFTVAQSNLCSVFLQFLQLFYAPYVVRVASCGLTRCFIFCHSHILVMFMQHLEIFLEFFLLFFYNSNLENVKFFINSQPAS